MGGRAAGEEQPAECPQTAMGHQRGNAEMAALKEKKGRPEDIGKDAAPHPAQPKAGKPGLPPAEAKSQAGKEEEDRNAEPRRLIAQQRRGHSQQAEPGGPGNEAAGSMKKDHAQLGRRPHPVHVSPPLQSSPPFFAYDSRFSRGLKPKTYLCSSTLTCIRLIVNNLYQINIY